MAKVVLTWEEPRASLAKLKEELASRDEYYWRTKDGTEVKLSEMSTSHLLNTINLLKNRIHEEEIVMENYVDALDYYD